MGDAKPKSSVQVTVTAPTGANSGTAGPPGRVAASDTHLACLSCTLEFTIRSPATFGCPLYPSTFSLLLSSNAGSAFLPSGKFFQRTHFRGNYLPFWPPRRQGIPWAPRPGTPGHERQLFLVCSSFRRALPGGTTTYGHLRGRDLFSLFTFGQDALPTHLFQVLAQEVGDKGGFFRRFGCFTTIVGDDYNGLLGVLRGCHRVGQGQPTSIGGLTFHFFRTLLFRGTFFVGLFTKSRTQVFGLGVRVQDVTQGPCGVTHREVGFGKHPRVGRGCFTTRDVYTHLGRGTCDLQGDRGVSCSVQVNGNCQTAYLGLLFGRQGGETITTRRVSRAGNGGLHTTSIFIVGTFHRGKFYVFYVRFGNLTFKVLAHHWVHTGKERRVGSTQFASNVRTLGGRFTGPFTNTRGVHKVGHLVHTSGRGTLHTILRYNVDNFVYTSGVIFGNLIKTYFRGQRVLIDHDIVGSLELVYFGRKVCTLAIPGQSSGRFGVGNFVFSFRFLLSVVDVIFVSVGGCRLLQLVDNGLPTGLTTS